MEICNTYSEKIKTFKASLYSSEKHFIFDNVLLMNRRLALKVFIIDKETSGLVIIKNKSLVPWRALGFIFNNHQAIGLYLLHNLLCIGKHYPSIPNYTFHAK